MKVRIDMKKAYFLWIIIWMMTFVGCSGETYVGELPDNDDILLTEPIPIVIGLGVPSYQVLARGSGPFENTLDEETKNLWENAQFFVYAFKKGADTDLRTTWSESTEDVCLLDGNRTLKEQNSGGKETRVNIDNTSLMPFWPDNDELKVYYNTKHTDWPYNFFAYYVDDSPVTVHREKDRIYLDVKADGRIDFMSAMAEPTDDQLKKFEGSSSKDKIFRCIYSAYSANKGLDPVFRFKHHMARFRFVIYSGESDVNKVPDIVLKGIDLMAKVNGEFTVAVSDPLTQDPEKPRLGLVFKEEQDEQALSLRESDNTDLKEYRVKLPDPSSDKTLFQQTSVYVGGSLLLPPQTTYRMKVYFVGDGETEDKPLEYDIAPPSPYTMFEAGMLYTVRIAIYSLSKIEIEGVSAGKWGEGGESDLNTGGWGD